MNRFGWWRFGVIGVVLIGVLALAATALGADVDTVEGIAFSGTIVTESLPCPTPAFTSATVAWGDGTAASAATHTQVNGTTSFRFGGSHTYKKVGTYNGTVSAELTCNQVDFQEHWAFTSAVSDAALTASPVPFTVAPGTAFSGTVAHVIDANPYGNAADDHATIDWGDGSATSAGTVVAAAGGGFDVQGTHTYNNAGSFAVVVTVGDTGSSTAHTTSTATVATSSATPPPTGTTPPPTTTTTTQTPQVLAPAPVVAAHITPVAAGPGSLTLDAAASAPPGTTAARYTWNLGGGPQADVVCPGTESKVTISAAVPLSGAVTLSAISATGATSATSMPMTIAAPRLPAGPAGRTRAGPASTASTSDPRGRAAAAGVSATHLTFTALCGSDQPLPTQLEQPKLATHLPTAQRPLHVSNAGAPPDGCDQDLDFGAADIHGCLSQIPDPSQLPGGITVGLSKLLCGAQDTDFCLGPLTSAAKNLGSSLLADASRAHAASTTIPTPQDVKSLVGELAVPSYYSYTAIRINGIDVVPQNGVPILIVPAAHAIVATQVRYYLGGRLLLPTTLPLILYLPFTGGHLGDLTLPRSVPIIGSLPFSGGISIDMARAHTRQANGTVCDYACTALSIHAEMPGVLSDDSGNGLSAAGVITADAVDGVQLDSLEVKVPDAELAGIGVKDVDVRYRREDDSLHAAATFKLFEVAGDITGTIDFVHGRFSGASVDWDHGDAPGIDLGGPFNIYLTHLGGSIALDPETVIQARASITGGPQTLGCALMGLDGTATLTFADKTSFDADADGSFLCQHVSHEYFHVDSSGSILIGADVDLHLLFLELKGGVAIAADLSSGHFQADANANICMDLPVIGSQCLGGEAVVSDRGMGICADLGFTHAGGGVQWPDNVLVFLDTCDIGKFRSLGFVTQAGAPPSVTIPKGENVAALAFDGTAAGGGKAPRLTLTGPNGRVIDVPDSGYAKRPHDFEVADDAQTHKTYVLIDHPAAGAWKVTLHPGSTPVTGLQQAAGLPDPDVHARVETAGHGGRLRVAYSQHVAPGQVVTLVERDAKGIIRRIGVLHGASGRLPFAPDPTLATGSRKLVAEVTQGDHPREDDVVATFRAPAVGPLPAPRGLHATRRGTSVAVRWNAVPGATAGYAVRVTQPGQINTYVLTKSRTATLHDLRVDGRATVSVQALRSAKRGRIGHAATRTLAGHSTAKTYKVKPVRVA